MREATTPALPVSVPLYSTRSIEQAVPIVTLPAVTIGEAETWISTFLPSRVRKRKFSPAPFSPPRALREGSSPGVSTRPSG